MVTAYRPTVTVALHALAEIGAIKLHRGQIEILDRAKLIPNCQGTYGHAEQLYSANISKFGCGGASEDGMRDAA